MVRAALDTRTAVDGRPPTPERRGLLHVLNDPCVLDGVAWTAYATDDLPRPGRAEEAQELRQRARETAIQRRLGRVPADVEEVQSDFCAMNGTVSTLLSRADTRVHVAERSGRNRVVTTDGATT